MAQGVRLSAAVMFVRDLDRSVNFYRDVLALQVIDRSATAALLSNDAGAQLILRAMGGTAAHTLGALGVQYIVWTAASEDDLDQCERLLRERSAFRERRNTTELSAIEGRDPDDIVLMIVYPGPDKAPLRELPARIYAW
jgi:catechol 2,3-dioxygenase-like lactoylglutathione lyase family enzyme